MLTSRNAMSATPITDTPSSALPRLLIDCRRLRMDQFLGSLDLGVEDVVDGLDGLGADLRGQLHGQPGLLDGHDDRGRVGRGPAGQRLAPGGGVVLQLAQLADLARQERAEAGAAGRALRSLAGAL